MNKFYVTKEIAEKLRAKGYYREYDITDDWVEGLFYQIEEGCFHLPRIDEVLDWLREEKGVYVNVCTFADHKKGGYFWGCEVYDFSEMPSIVRYKHSIFEKEDYKEAAIAGIEYCLDNLI